MLTIVWFKVFLSNSNIYPISVHHFSNSSFPFYGINYSDQIRLIFGQLFLIPIYKILSTTPGFSALEVIPTKSTPHTTDLQKWSLSKRCRLQSYVGHPIFRCPNAL